MIPDLSWLESADTDTRMTVALVALALLIAALALLARAERQIRGALRYIGRWVVRAARWIAARWDALWQGCIHCGHCHPDQADAAHRARWTATTAGARHATGPHYIPARIDAPGDTR